MNSNTYETINSMLEQVASKEDLRFSSLNIYSDHIATVIAHGLSSIYSNPSIDLNNILDMENIKSINFEEFKEFLNKADKIGPLSINILTRAIGCLIDGTAKNSPYNDMLVKDSEAYIINLTYSSSKVAKPRLETTYSGRLLLEKAIYENIEPDILAKEILVKEYSKRRVYFTALKLSKIMNEVNPLINRI